MERKKFGASLIAFVAGIALSAGTVFAQEGYLQGDSNHGKLVPFYQAEGNTATIIGLENVSGDLGPSAGMFINVHVTVLDVTSVEVINFDMCLSPFDFGFLILQDGAPSAAQSAETGAAPQKRIILSVENTLIPHNGYVTFAVTHSGSSCGTLSTPIVSAPNGLAGYLVAWTILQDVSSGFFGTEIPTSSARVHGVAGNVDCDNANAAYVGQCYGLIPRTNGVIARYDVNDNVGSVTTVFVWLEENAGVVSSLNRASNTPSFWDCENEQEISVQIPLPVEVNWFDPTNFPGLDLCTQNGAYRGVVRFNMPATGILWSHISQVGANFRMNFLGINMGINSFIAAIP